MTSPADGRTMFTWEREKQLADCYPLGNLEESFGMVAFDGLTPSIKNTHLVSDEVFPLWVAQIAENDGLDPLLNRLGPSDLKRLWPLLENAHRQSHDAMKQVEQTPSLILDGVYLSMIILHEGITALMDKVHRKLI